MNDIIRLAKALEKTQEKLSEAVCNKFPVGSIIEVTINNRRFTGEVITHGASWYDPKEITVMNIASGKKYKFRVTTPGHNPVVVDRK